MCGCRLLIIPLHSTITADEQAHVFDTTKPEVRKVSSGQIIYFRFVPKFIRIKFYIVKLIRLEIQVKKLYERPY